MRKLLTKQVTTRPGLVSRVAQDGSLWFSADEAQGCTMVLSGQERLFRTSGARVLSRKGLAVMLNQVSRRDMTDRTVEQV